MSFARYPTYKDSGVAWLGEVPGHWDIRPIKALAMLKGGVGFPDAEQGLENEELYFYKVAALGQADAKGMLQAAPDSVSRETAIRLGAFIFPAGTLTFAKVGAALLLARIRQLPAPSCLDNNMMGMLVNNANETRFVLFAMSLVRFDLIANPGAVPSLNASQIGNFQLAIPPLAEQTAIATFLDRETAKIDALVAEQERLIALLQEKRQAVISHAVTRGLNPSAPMKDSGVQWLGEVPGHWEAKRLKFLASNIKAGPFGSALTKDMYVSSGYRVYGQEQVIPDDFSVGNYYIDEVKFSELSQYETKADDVLISCVGTFGKIAVVPTDAEPGIINPRLLRLRTTENVMPLFLAEVLRSTVTFEQFSILSRGGTMDVINIGTLSDIWIALPPREEQSAILREITTQMTRFDALMTEARTAITLLQERRSALICAAVTGQIDVRAQAV